MVVQVLELRPSAAGWYYPYLPSSVALSPSLQASRPVAGIAPGHEETVAWGYGPDGRVRLVAPRPRLWLLV